MAAIIEEKERRVIPNWRSFGTTVALGELNTNSLNGNASPNLSIESYIREFNNNHTVPYAADLISAALVNGFTDNKNVEEAAKFLLDHKYEITISQGELANRILNGPLTSQNTIEDITIRQLNDCISNQDFINNIGRLKQHLIKLPIGDKMSMIIIKK